MSATRLLAGLTLFWVCVLVHDGGWARAQQTAAPPIPPPPPTRPERLPEATVPPSPPAKDSAHPPIVEPPLPTTAPRKAAQELDPKPSPAAPTSSRQEPAVSLEWVGPTTIRLGQPALYQIVLRNVCSCAVYQVVVRCPVPEGATASIADPMPGSKSGLWTWDIGTLPAGQEKRIELQMVPAVKTSLDLQAVVSFTSIAGMRVQVREPKLALKMMAPPQVMLGDSATVTMTVSNPGDGPAEHVRIRAVLPEGLEHPRGRQIEVDLGTLAPQEQRTLQLVCTAKGQGALRCEAAATADGGLKTEGVAPVEVVLPRLDLVAIGPHLRYLERKAIYVFKATNPGSAPAANVTIQTVLPPAMKFHGASAGGQYDATAGAVSWFVGDLPPGQSREVSVEVIPVVVGSHHVHGTVMAARGLKTDADVLTRVEGLSALLMELADADDPVEVGTDTSYEIRVTNTGSNMETNLQLTCTLPDQMEFRGARCAAGSRYRVEGREVVFEPLPRLAPKADVVYRVFVRGTAPGDLRFRARIRADGLSEPVLREESTKVYGDDVGPR